MENFLGYIQLILLFVSAIGLGFGVDLKKWHSWLYIVCAFMFGLILGINTQEMTAGVVVGVFAALFLIVFGPIMLRRRRDI